MLLTHDEVYVEASRLALEAVFGIYAEGPDIPGDTAPAHIRRALRTVSIPEAKIDAGLPRWCKTFSDHYVRLLAAADTSHWQLAPYAAEAAAAVEHRALEIQLHERADSPGQPRIETCGKVQRDDLALLD